LEFVLLFFGIPLLIYFDEDFIHPSIIILPVLIFIFLLLRRTTDFQWRELFRWKVSADMLVKKRCRTTFMYPAYPGLCLLF
jgi:hypothetical protein